LGDPTLENAVRCAGDTIILPQNGQYSKLYLLAASVSGDAIATFYVDGNPSEQIVPYYSGFVGQWDHIGFTKGFFKPEEVAFTGTHRHSSENNVDAPYEFTYLFKYCINIPKNAKQLVLTNDSKVLLFAASLAANENDNIIPAVNLVTTGLSPEVLKSTYAMARKNLLMGKSIIGKSNVDDANANNNRNNRRGGRPEAAIDGNFNSQWFDLIENGKTPYIEVDMEKVNTIKGWFVLQGGESGPNNTFAKEYRLEVKKNLNDPWQIVDAVKDNKASETNRLLSSPIAARYVRLTVLKGAQEERGVARISEFEVY
jgi:alpha-mannosidase